MGKTDKICKKQYRKSAFTTILVFHKFYLFSCDLICKKWAFDDFEVRPPTYKKYDSSIKNTFFKFP